MKVLSILTYYLPHWTGLTAYAARIAEGLVRRGHEVTVLTTRHHPSLAAREERNGVKVIRLAPFLRVSRGVIAPTLPIVASQLIRCSEVVQIHTPLMESALIALLCRCYRRPLLMTHHGDLVMPAGLLNQSVERLVVASMNLAARLCSRISVHSQDYAENSGFLAPFSSKLTCVYPPVRIPRPQQEAAAEWRRSLGLESRRVIGFAGRFVEEKGFDFLLGALPRILAAEPSAHLLFAGESNVVYEDFYARLKHQIDLHRDSLTSLGLLREPQELANFFALCDVFVVPSRTDCFPSIQIEAMLCGTPVVCSNIPGAREAIRVRGAGRLVESHRPDRLSKGILRVLSNRRTYRKSRGEIESLFNPRQSLDQYESLLGNLVENSPAAFAPSQKVSNVPRSRWLSQRDDRSHLCASDQTELDKLLRNEADMAFRRRVPILMKYLALKDGDRVLDCGCGMGFHLMVMARLRKLELLGLDIDPDRLDSLRKEGVGAPVLVADIGHPPLAEESFDKVLMTEVLEHLENDRQVLSTLYRVLKPGGILALSVPSATYPFWWDPFNRIWTGIGGDPIRKGPLVGIWTNHRRLYQTEQLVSRIREAGFAVEAVAEITHYCFPFMHFLVYGLGKPLLERNLLPRRLHQSADRFKADHNRGSLLNPINLGLEVFRAVDRLNDRPGFGGKKTFVSIVVKASRPGVGPDRVNT